MGRSTIHFPSVNPVAINATVSQCSAIAVRVYETSVGIIGRTSAMRAPLDSSLLPPRIGSLRRPSAYPWSYSANNGRVPRIPQLSALARRLFIAVAFVAATVIATVLAQARRRDRHGGVRAERGAGAGRDAPPEDRRRALRRRRARTHAHRRPQGARGDARSDRLRHRDQHGSDRRRTLCERTSRRAKWSGS